MPEDKRWFVRHWKEAAVAASLALAITVSGFTISLQLCKPLPNLIIEQNCQASSNLGIYVGAIIGTITGYLFYLISENQNKLRTELRDVLEPYARAYILRTCLFNFKDVLSKEGTTAATEENRQYYLNKLYSEYIKKFHIEGLAKTIHDLAAQHEEIRADHDPKNCGVCRDSPTDDGVEEGLISKIKRCLDDTRNPLLPPS